MNFVKTNKFKTKKINQYMLRSKNITLYKTKTIKY